MGDEAVAESHVSTDAIDGSAELSGDDNAAKGNDPFEDKKRLSTNRKSECSNESSRTMTGALRISTFGSKMCYSKFRSDGLTSTNP
ncbi:hypothetical protein [Halorubrum vacuolatum]|uniref:hypothetical protein n=1 Tax=Halorubrum vacuolatum TaxID=63740 RepID=UPI000B796322|nr:hypothetical protein [Halorubrum vacuolatum]